MKKYLLVLIVPILFALSCQKNQSDTYVADPQPIADYLPTTAGSSWVYDMSDGNGGSYGNFTVTATNDHLQKDGKTFNVLSGGSILPDGGDKTYIYKTEGQYKNYYIIVHDAPTGIDFDVPVLLNRKVLNKDTTFYIAGPDASKPPMWQVELFNGVQNYQSVTVKGKTYNNCIVTSVNILKYNDDASSKYYGIYEVYYTCGLTFAPNVGLLEAASNYQIFTLASSDIK